MRCSQRRSTSKPKAVGVAVTEKRKQHEERTEEHSVTGPETAADEGLPTLLQQLIAGTESGAKVAVRQVAKELRIGSSKATKLLQQAAEIGVLHKTKTPGGYVAA
ncbi:hypothetical protein IB274_06050 [Pseudomonas sp. PDM18]|uniref:hypothetical protein n=1 Tax=Pseudomonas sp. PDM18 TaxID=2769253 RepID=UPI001780A1C4|nr:hypothetical protein [Pseudomonas sp. PDM18]MBD9676255.1 hypothetical protein [Pseudomonas sp. PDM18]